MSETDRQAVKRQTTDMGFDIEPIARCLHGHRRQCPICMLEAEVARLTGALESATAQRDKWLGNFNRSEQFQNGPTKKLEALTSALTRLRDEMRMIQMVAGQCSVEGPDNECARMAGAEADRAGKWADKIDALLPADPPRKEEIPL